MKRNLIIVMCTLCWAVGSAKSNKNEEQDYCIMNEQRSLESNPSYKLKIETTNDLIMYDVTDCQLDLACGNMPEIDQEDVVLCVAAAFTGKCLDSFSHSNILGPHISQGILYEGYDEEGGYAIFASWGEEKGFFELGNQKKLEEVVEARGMAFTQYWVVKDGKGYNPPRQTIKEEYYRCIAQKGGRTYVIELINVYFLDWHQLPPTPETGRHYEMSAKLTCQVELTVSLQPRENTALFNGLINTKNGTEC